VIFSNFQNNLWLFERENIAREIRKWKIVSCSHEERAQGILGEILGFLGEILLFGARGDSLFSAVKYKETNH
jgi:hypothetical protein